MESESIVLYRIVRTNPPTADDMHSYVELGIPLMRDDPQSRWRAQGISVFDSLQQARRLAQRKPWLGAAFIAELAIPVSRFELEKTGGRGHYTLWGDPHAILHYVRRVEPAE